MKSFDNADSKEIEKFDKVSQMWWDPKSEMGTLHTINPLRTRFILEKLTTRNPRILDVGCGGGILSEALAKEGAQVMGLDLSDTAIQVAKQHARQQKLEIDYRYESVEQIARERPGSFDVVTCMEMLEHVPEPARAMGEMSRVLRPGGFLVLSTPMYWPRHEAPYDFFRYPYDGLLRLVKVSGLELTRLFNRGRSYAFVGQVVQHVQPVSAKPVNALINSFFLWCDRRLKHDAITMGWTLVARKPGGGT